MPNFQAANKIQAVNIHSEKELMYLLREAGIDHRIEKQQTDIFSGLGGNYSMWTYFYAIDGERRVAYEMSGATDTHTSIVHRAEHAPTYHQAKALLSYVARVGDHEYRPVMTDEKMLLQLGIV
jgi:hypothetical protein